MGEVNTVTNSKYDVNNAQSGILVDGVDTLHAGIGIGNDRSERCHDAAMVLDLHSEFHGKFLIHLRVPSNGDQFFRSIA